MKRPKDRYRQVRQALRRYEELRGALLVDALRRCDARRRERVLALIWRKTVLAARRRVAEGFARERAR